MVLFEFLTPEHIDGNEAHPDADGDVGDVERRPAVIPSAPRHVRVDEVDDVRVADAIDEIAERAAEHERKTPLERELVRRKTPVKREDERDGDRRDEKKERPAHV